MRRGGGTDCHTSDIGHWFAMTGFLHGVQYGGTMWASSPTDCLPIEFRRGRCPHRPGGTSFHVMRRAEPACPAGGAVENRFGSSGRPTPTLLSTIELRRGRARPCPYKRSGRPLLWVNIGKLLVSGRALTVMAFYAILKSESIGAPHTV